MHNELNQYNNGYIKPQVDFSNLNQKMSNLKIKNSSQSYKINNSLFYQQ